MPNIYYRRLSDQEIIGTVNADSVKTWRTAERVVMGMLRNMRDDLFVDDSELDFLYRQETATL